MKTGIRLAIVLTALCGAAARSDAARVVRAVTRQGYAVQAVAEAVIVRFKYGVTAVERQSLHWSLGAVDEGEIPGTGWYSVRLPAGLSIETALAQYAASPFVEAAEPNRVYSPAKAPNDPLLPSQSGLYSVDAVAGWEFETGLSSPVVAAVIDTGVDASHPEISGKIIPSHSASFDPYTGAMSPEATPTDCSGHGTHVAGIIGAATDNGQGIAGVAWGAQILSLRVFANACNQASDVAVSSAIVYAVSVASATGRRMVINMSLGDKPSSLSDTCSPVLNSAVSLALANNIPVVASAGNYITPDSTVGKAVMCPARISGVIAASAVDSEGQAASFSAEGPQLWVSAPGISVTSLLRGGGYAVMSGTSQAAPHVAGAVALILSASPVMTASRAAAVLKESADDYGPAGFDNTYGYGRLNLFKALRLTVKGTLSDFAGEQKVIAFPSPFHVGSDKYLSFAVPSGLGGGRPEIKIYTMSGELVKTLNALVWDGKNDSGAPAASGVYVFIVKTSAATAKGRFALIR